MKEDTIMTGKQAEQFVAETFSKDGFWVHIFKKGIDGQQPFDMIAIKNKQVWCCDIKHCDKDVFPFSRVEENQKQSLSFLNDFHSHRVGFILVYRLGIFYLSYYEYLKISKDNKAVKLEELPQLFI